MKKIKLFIASFIGAIALVFAFGFSSVNVNAYSPEPDTTGTVGNYDYVAKYTWLNNGGGSSSDTFYFHKQGNTGSTGTLAETSFKTGFTWEYNGVNYSTFSLPNGNMREITINLPDWDYGKIIANVYLTTSSGSRTVTIGGVTSTALIDDDYGSVQLKSGEITSSKNVITLSGNNVGWCAIEIICEKVQLSFNAQYNEVNAADSTKLRFMGKIAGISYDNYANITSMQFTFTFKGLDRVCAVTRLYKSITSNGDEIDGFGLATNTMYVVYQLKNINKEAYKGQTLSNCKFTLTFSDGSTKSVSHDDITLPNFTTVIA